MARTRSVSERALREKSRAERRQRRAGGRARGPL